MADLRPPGDAALERALLDLGARLDYPPTPPLAAAVRRRLLARPLRRHPFWARLAPGPRRLAFALAALLVLAGALLLLSPETRTAVADRLGLRGVTIFHVPSAPTPPPAPPTTTPAPLGARLMLGERLTLAEAQARVPYRILVPSLPDLGAPDEVYLAPSPPGPVVALVYRARPGLAAADETGLGLLLIELQGDLDPGFLGKGLPPGTRVETVAIDGAAGYWVEGQPHLFFYRDAQGTVREETIRLAGNTLLWERAGLTLRVESALGRDEAVRIAASMR